MIQLFVTPLELAIERFLGTIMQSGRCGVVAGLDEMLTILCGTQAWGRFPCSKPGLTCDPSDSHPFNASNRLYLSSMGLEMR